MGRDRSGRRKGVDSGRCGRNAIGEEIELSAADEQILDRVWKVLAAEQKTRLDRYSPVMGKLVRWLRVLDAEATPLPSGYPVGLVVRTS